MKLLTNILKLFGICFLRFRLLSRLWVIWLVLANSACLAFLTRAEGIVVLAVTGLAVLLQALIMGRIGFTRILGVVHLMWVPMFMWMATRTGLYAQDPSLQLWLMVLLATNAVSLLIDMSDSLRFLKGERKPHYSW